MECFAYNVVDRGYYAENASEVLIYDNRAYNCDMGIYVSDCYSADIFFNEVYDASYDNGIYVENSEDIAVQYNIADRSKNNGIEVSNCTSAYVGLNNCTDNGKHGVSVEDSEYSLIETNRFIDCDLGVYAETLEDLLTYDVYLDNTINDELIYYSENENMAYLPGWIQKYPQMILINSSDVTIVGQDLFAHNIYSPLVLQYGSYATIQDCYFENCTVGVYGLELDNIVVSKCSFLQVAGGVGFIRTNNSILQYNSVMNASIVGFSLADSDSNLVFNNHFENIGFYGLSLTGSNNVIYHNNFDNCSSFLGLNYGWDEGSNNYWYSETLQEGNWWSNWGGVGPYQIEGPVGALDLYPLGSVIPIPEFSNSGILLEILAIISFVSVVFVFRKRK